jgi:hypothetical protein
VHPDLAEAIVAWDRATDLMTVAIRAVDADAWARDSVYPGWTNKDLLAHLASGYAVRLALLRSVAASGKVAELPDADAANARAISARRDTPVEQLIEEMLATRRTIRGLLESLRDGDLDLGVEVNGGQVPLRDYVAGLSRHDLEHLADLPAAGAPPAE